MLSDFSLTGLLMIDRAAAQIISGGAQQAAGPLVGSFAGGTGVTALNNLAQLIWTKSWVLAGAAATYNIVRAGVRLINSQEEDKLSKARRTILLSLVGVMALYLVPRFISAIYTAGGPSGVFATPGGVTAGATVFVDELYGILRWTSVVLVPLGIGMIVISGFRVIASFGSEDAVPVMRRAIASVGTGLLLILLDPENNPVIKNTLGIPNFGLPGTPSTGPIIVRGLAIVQSLLSFLALIAVVIVAYAGILLILSLGSEEEKTKAKGLLTRSAIGLLVVSISYAFIAFIVSLAA